MGGGEGVGLEGGSMTRTWIWCVFPRQMGHQWGHSGTVVQTTHCWHMDKCLTKCNVHTLAWLICQNTSSRSASEAVFISCCIQILISGWSSPSLCPFKLLPYLSLSGIFKKEHLFHWMTKIKWENCRENAHSYMGVSRKWAWWRAPYMNMTIISSIYLAW